MARTIYGNLTGRAAATERQERRNDMLRASIEEGRHKTRLFWRRWFRWLNELKNLDPGWEAWYDARPEQTPKEMFPLIQERVRNLRSR